MKKLILLVCLFVGIGMSASVMAQSTGIRPYVGETKTYQVTANAAGTFTWTLTTSATDATTGDLLPAGAIASAPASYSGLGKNSIAVTWVNPTVPTIYYLHVVETEAGCSNHKVLAIQPANNFTLAIANINETNAGAILADPYEDCAPTVSVTSWNDAAPLTTINDLTEAQNFTYNYGTKVFYYRISADGINFATTTWDAKFTVASAVGSGVSVDYLTATDNTATPNWTSPTAGVVGLNTINNIDNKKTIFVRVTVANGTTNETLANQNFTITLDASSQEDLGNQTAIISDATSVQTQTKRPTMGAITPVP